MLHEQVDGTRAADRVTVPVDDGELARRPLDAGAQGDVGAEVDERDARVRPCGGQLRRVRHRPGRAGGRGREQWNREAGDDEDEEERARKA